MKNSPEYYALYDTKKEEDQKDVETAVKYRLRRGFKNPSLEGANSIIIVIMSKATELLSCPHPSLIYSENNKLQSVPSILQSSPRCSKRPRIPPKNA